MATFWQWCLSSMFLCVYAFESKIYGMRLKHVAKAFGLRQLCPDARQYAWKHAACMLALYIYVSLMEFGGVALGKEQAWLPLACPRSSSVSSLPGGISQVVATVLKDIFLGPVDPEHAGLTLKSLDGFLHRLKFKLGCFVQDGQAHKMMFSIKADQGARCCALCQNIIVSTADLEAAGCILASEAYKEEQLAPTTEESWANSIISLIEKKDELSKGDFALWQQASGLSYNSHALIFDPDLCHMIRPVTQLAHDYMHGFFVKGIWKLSLHWQFSFHMCGLV